MIHKWKGRKLGRTAAHRSAMLSNQAASLIRYGRIKTTLPKCKELRTVVEKLITTAKSDTVHARRMVNRFIQDKTIIKKLFTDVAPEFSERPGGYTQILKIGPRANDGAQMAYIQFVGYDPEAEDED
ncbi:MAG: 50S ribosomal protein L17 [Candidatus Hinthialibacter antarcticus]|nr:50S ribosomal protein L17 [Candidatus Hinthialibacter antarcticus]